MELSISFLNIYPLCDSFKLVYSLNQSNCCTWRTWLFIVKNLSFTAQCLLTVIDFSGKERIWSLILVTVLINIHFLFQDVQSRSKFVDRIYSLYKLTAHKHKVKTERILCKQKKNSSVSLSFFPETPVRTTMVSRWAVHVPCSSVSPNVHLFIEPGLPGSLSGKGSSCQAGDARDVGSVPGWGRSPGGGNGKPLQYPCLGIPWTEEAGGLQCTGLPRAGRYWAPPPPFLRMMFN